MEKPYIGRASFEETLHGVQIMIPSKKNWFAIPLLCIWLCGWIVGEFFALSILLGGLYTHKSEFAFVGVFMLVWVSFWTFGGFMAIRSLIWLLIGKEFLVFERGSLWVRKEGFLLNKPKEYDLKSIKKIRAQEAVEKYKSHHALNSIGVIAFDYGMKTIRVGENIDEAEGNYLIDKLLEKKILTDANL